MRKNRVSQHKQEQLLKLFIADSITCITTELVGVLVYYFQRLSGLVRLISRLKLLRCKLIPLFIRQSNQ